MMGFFACEHQYNISIIANGAQLLFNIRLLNARLSLSTIIHIGNKLYYSIIDEYLFYVAQPHLTTLLLIIFLYQHTLSCCISYVIQMLTPTNKGYRGFYSSNYLKWFRVYTKSCKSYREVSILNTLILHPQ